MSETALRAAIARERGAELEAAVERYGDDVVFLQQLVAMRRRAVSFHDREAVAEIDQLCDVAHEILRRAERAVFIAEQASEDALLATSVDE